MINTLLTLSTNSSPRPSYTFSGISGPQAHAQGLSPWPNCQPKKIMGFTQVLRHIQHYRRLLATITTASPIPPTATYFNRLCRAKFTRCQDCTPTQYPGSLLYSTKKWAWGTRRIRKFNNTSPKSPCSTHSSTLFTARSVPSTLVQHPFTQTPFTANRC